jgi:hypothetical protein
MGIAASAFGQGTVFFDNRVAGVLATHVYAPYFFLSQIGNGSNDTPPGATSWAGFTPIGANGTGGLFGGATTFAQLLAAPGSNQSESSLVPAGPATTFRTGRAAGFLAPVTATLSNVAADAPNASIEMVAWDNSSGLYPTWTQASLAWRAGLICAGESGIFNVSNIGGTINIPPYLVGLQSFNLYGTCPEPSTIWLALSGAGLLVRLRKSAARKLRAS